MASPYVPLVSSKNEIRLLILSPASHPDDGRIQCQLCHESVSDGIDYEALSYMWGDPDALGNKIWLGGTLVDVRENLYNALCCLRTESERIIWIDALCINQNDVKERNHQVGLMGLVYKNATRVLVWLGLPPPSGQNRVQGIKTRKFWGRIIKRRITSSPAFDLLRLVYDCMACSRGWDTILTNYGLAKRSRYSELPPKTFPSRWPEYWIHLFVGDPKLSSEWKELHEFLHLRYWQRLWIVQEILLAKDILLVQGFETCPWGCLSAFFALRESYSYYTDRSVWAYFESNGIARRLCEHRERRERSSRTYPSLYDLLSAFESSSCQDPRDKVFGLLGLLEASARKAVVVDYSRPLLELFGDIIQKDKILSPGHNLLDTAELLQRALLKSLAPLSWERPAPCDIGARTMCIGIGGFVSGRIVSFSRKTLPRHKAHGNFRKLKGVKRSEFNKALFKRYCEHSIRTQNFLGKKTPSTPDLPNSQLCPMEHGIIGLIRTSAPFMSPHSNLQVSSERNPINGVSYDEMDLGSQTTNWSEIQNSDIALDAPRKGDLLYVFETSPSFKYWSSAVTVVIRRIKRESRVLERAEEGGFDEEQKWMIVCRAFKRRKEELATAENSTGILDQTYAIAKPPTHKPNRNLTVLADITIIQQLTRPEISQPSTWSRQTESQGWAPWNW